MSVTRPGTAFVAASSEGLGFAVAKALAQTRTRVILNGRCRDKLEKALQNLQPLVSGEVLCWEGDVTCPEAPEKIIAAFGEIDILVTNAAGPSPRPFQELTADDFGEAFQANAVAMISLIKAVLPGMTKAKFGRIVNILSTSALRPIEGLDASAAARAGLVAALRSIAKSCVKDGVTINHVLPGPILTSRTRFYVEKMAAAKGCTLDESLAALTSTIPAGRVGLPEEVGELCAFLCSPHAGYITAQSICIDGGLTI